MGMTFEIPNNHVQIGGRKSKLAVVQSEIVKDIIETKYKELTCSILALSTLGDKVQSKPLYLFGGKALWTKELETLLFEELDEFPKLDLIVHSLKDMPTNLPDEFELGCILDRKDPRDALVIKEGLPYKCLADIPSGSVVGTSSVRRLAQLMKNYPNLRFESVRGNLQTRLQKLDAEDSPFVGLLLASAGLDRVDLGYRITARLDAPEMYYAVGQGALGIEIRKDDHIMKSLLQTLDDKPTTYKCLAERSLMRHLEGGCSVPIGVHTTYVTDTSELIFKAIVVSPDGKHSVEGDIVRKVTSTEEANQLGIDLGDILVKGGAKSILQAIDFERINVRPDSADKTQSSQPSQPTYT